VEAHSTGEGEDTSAANPAAVQKGKAKVEKQIAELTKNMVPPPPSTWFLLPLPLFLPCFLLAPLPIPALCF
jgi:hypothetical protein